MSNMPFIRIIINKLSIRTTSGGAHLMRRRGGSKDYQNVYRIRSSSASSCKTLGDDNA